MTIASPVAGETKLEKSVVRSYIVGTPGTPGIPGRPGTPAHTVLIAVNAPSGLLPPGWGYSVVPYPVGSPQYGEPPRFVPTPPASADPNQAAVLLQPGAVTYREVQVPADPGTPGTPGVPAVPSQIVIENSIGWNTSGRTVAEITAAGRHEFYAPLNLVGAVCGLYQFPTLDYSLLTHALYLEHGSMQVCESGTLGITVYSYLDTDKLGIVIDAGGQVHYQKNGVTFYRSTVFSPSFVRLVVCLYVSLDAIYDVVTTAGYNAARSEIPRPIGYSLDHGNNIVPFGRLPKLTGLAKALAIHANVSGTFPGLYGYAFDTANNAVSRFRPLTGVSAYQAHTAYGTFTGLIGYAGHAAAFLNAAFPRMTSIARSGGIMPQYVIAEGVMPGLTGVSLALLYNRATSSATMKSIIGIAGHLRYAFSSTLLKKLIGRITSFPPGYTFIPSFSTAQDTTYVTQHLIVAIVSRAQASGITGNGSGSGPGMFIGTITLPQHMQEMLLVSDSFTMRDALFRSIMSTVQAIAGTTTALTLGLKLIAMVNATGKASSTMSMHQSMYVMMAERLKIGGLRAAGLDPAGGNSGGSSGDEFVPTGLTAPNGETWVINLDSSSKPSSRYEGFDFNSFAMVGGRYYGARDDGVYLLEGDTDNGAEIKASVDFGNLNFGNLALKRPTNAYIGVTSSGNLVMKVEAEGQSYLYVARQASASIATQRFDFGKGISGNYLNFELFNGSGEDFVLESIEFMVVPLSRRVRG